MAREYVIQSRHKWGVTYYMGSPFVFNEFGPLEKARRYAFRSLAEAAMRKYGMNRAWAKVVTVKQAEEMAEGVE